MSKMHFHCTEKGCSGTRTEDPARIQHPACPVCCAIMSPSDAAGGVYAKLGGSGQKETNPKAAFGDAKVPLHVVPKPALYWQALAHAHGAMKYGAHNWRVSGVRATTYLNAAKRHLDLYEEGQLLDSESGLPHLAHVAACVNIIMDAMARGKLNDDRPPKSDDGWLENITAVYTSLRERYPEPVEPYTEAEHGEQKS